MQQQHQQSAAIYAMVTAHSIASATPTPTPKATKILAAAAKDSCTHDVNNIHKGNITCINSKWQLHR